MRCDHRGVSTPAPVTALVLRSRDRCGPRDPRGVAAGHDHPPETVLEASDLRNGVRIAAATDPGWIWLLDEAAVPGPDALGQLLRFDEDPGGLPAPLVLTSKVVDGAGALREDALPQHVFRRREFALAACGQRVMAVRAARNGSVLIRADAIARFGLPRRGLPFDWGIFEWTARILRGPGDVGYLVPGSVAQIDGPPRPPAAAYRSRLMMLAGPAWAPQDWRREAYQLAADVTGGLRRAPRA